MPTRIGALVSGSGAPAAAAADAAALAALGFEGFEIEFWNDTAGVDLGALADAFADLRYRGIAVSSLGVYGNTLDPDGATLASLESLIEAAGRFGSAMVSCFAGRVPGTSVPDSLERYKAVFGELAEMAAARGLTIALENCRLGDTWKTGKWNIAINPDAWELLFSTLPGAPIGLEWEPAHQLLALADPPAQLRDWAPRIVHVHGKDARVDRTALAVKGFFAASRVGHECLPGEGDTDWAEILRILDRAGYGGSLDLELPAEGPGARDAERDRVRLRASLAWLRSASTQDGYTSDLNKNTALDT